MSLPPTTFRLPFQLPDDVHPLVRMAIRYTFSGILDAQNAIDALNTKVAPAVAAAASAASTAGGGTTTTSVSVGGVNDQTGNTLYQIQGQDFGALIIVNTPSPFSLQLNNSITPPFYCVVENLGTGVIRATPGTGNVNNGPSYSLIQGQAGLIYFDGVNFWITTLPQYLLGGSTGTGRVVLDSSATLRFPTIDSGTLVSCTSTGITSILGLQVFANNGAALAGGLVAGNLYRSGGNPDAVLVVH